MWLVIATANHTAVSLGLKVVFVAFFARTICSEIELNRFWPNLHSQTIAQVPACPFLSTAENRFSVHVKHYHIVIDGSCTCSHPGSELTPFGSPNAQPVKYRAFKLPC